MNILNYLRIFVKKLFQLDYKCLGKNVFQQGLI